MVKKDFIKSYKLNLKILSPVHIGDGKDNVKKTEYIFDKENRQLLFPDQRLFADFLEKQKHTDNFCSFIQGSPQNGLKEWLDKQGVGRNRYEKFCSYALDMTSNIDEIEKLNDVCLFIKDKDSRPYIPGTSIKGALRTAIIWKSILDNNKAFGAKYWERMKKSLLACQNRNEEKRAIKDLKGIIDQIQQDVFYKIEFQKGRQATKIPNDIFRAVNVSDTKSIDNNNLLLVQKKDFVVNDKKELAISSLPIFRESLKPGCETEVVISLDDTFLKLTETYKNFSIEDILSALESMSNFYNENIVSYADLHPDIVTNITLKGNVNIGAGTGYLIKTLPYILAPNIKDAVHPVRSYMDYKFKKAKHMLKDKIISPRTFKMGYVDGNPLELGWCRLEVKK